MAIQGRENPQLQMATPKNSVKECLQKIKLIAKAEPLSATKIGAWT